MNPACWLQRTAIRCPDAPALMQGEILEADYAEFYRRAAALASVMACSHNVQAGERVVIFMKNHTRYLEIMYATWFLGAAVVPVNAKLHHREVAWIVEDSGAQLVFCEEADENPLAALMKVPTIAADNDGFTQYYNAGIVQIPAYMQPADLAWLFYTSGTTGRPKGVMISTANILAMCGSYFMDVDSVESRDAALYAAPMSHGAGIYNFMHVQCGARHIVPPSRGFDEAEIFELSRNCRNTSLFAAPTMVKRLVEHAKQYGQTGDGIKTITYGGGPMYLADICDGISALGNRFVQIYGQGECPMAITALSKPLVSDRSHVRWRERLGSVGLAQSCVEVRVCDCNGEFLPAGEVGEIVVAGTAVMIGYWNNPEATRKTLRNGWLWTGDMGSLDEDGFLTLRDRSKDMIISGGSNIYPREIEEVLLEHESVHEVSVVGKADEHWGEVVVAFVVPTFNAVVDESTLDAFCLDNIARFKRPKSYIFVDELPKNNYGKVLKTELRTRLL